MTRTKSINILVLLLALTTLFSMGSVYYHNESLRMASYIPEVLIIFLSLYNSDWKFKGTSENVTVLLISLIIIANYLVSPYEHSYIDLLKFFGYYCCYRYGYTLASKSASLEVNKYILYAFIFIPVVVVAFFDDTVKRNAFFVTPNTFVFFGLSMGLLYTLVEYKNAKAFWIAWLFVALYVFLCASLGVVIAIFLSYLLLNFKKSHLPYLLLGCTTALLAMLFVDLPVFVRFRDTITLWATMTANDWRNLTDLDYYEMTQRTYIEGTRTDITSSIWRLAQWTRLFLEYVKQIWTIPFGKGVGFSADFTGLQPHNDYLLILVEYGLVVFSSLIVGIRKFYMVMRKEGRLVFFIFSMLFYFLTENLIQTFPPNVVLFFAIGWCWNKLGEKKKVSIKLLGRQN